MTLALFSPSTDVVSLREAMDRLFEDSFTRPNGWSGLVSGQVGVPVDLWETKDAYHLRADLPGLTAEDIEINATSDTITFGGEIKAQADATEDSWLRQERRTGKFQRLHPAGADRPEQGRGEVHERRSGARGPEGREHQAAHDQDQRE